MPQEIQRQRHSFCDQIAHSMILMVDAIRYNARQKDAIKNVEKLLGEFGEEFFPTENEKHYLYLIFKYV